MAEPFLGQIILFAGNFTIRNYAMCNGQLLSIAQNTALFSILGTTYGGNGQTTFGLPDLRSRVPVHFGQGNGLSNYVLGQIDGTETVTLLTNQMPQHNHGLNVAAEDGNVAIPNSSTSLGITIVPPSSNANTYYNGAPTTPLNPASVGIAGGSQPHNNLQPYLALNYLIALQGIFPTRN